MKLLVAVMTCHALDYFIDDLTQDWLKDKRWLNQPERVAAQRATWLKALPEGVDYKFFYGRGVRDLKKYKPNCHIVPALLAPEREQLSDEIFLDVNDHYAANSFKMKEICRWAFDHGYDYILRVDDDTYIYPQRLFAEKWQFNYAGSPNGSFHPGSCVFLSRHAMGLIVDARVTSYADDLWVGDVMARNNISMHSIDSIRHEFGDSYLVRFDEVKDKNYSALHSCKPQVMRDLWTLETTSSSEQPKDTDGIALKTTPSPYQKAVSEAEKFYSSVTSPTLQEKLSQSSDSNSSITSAPETIPSSNDSESSETGSMTLKTAFGILSTVMSET